MQLTLTAAVECKGAFLLLESDKIGKMKSSIPFIVLLVSLSGPLAAQDGAEKEQDSKPDKATQRENPVSAIPYETGDKKKSTCEDRWSNFLPIWGKAACERGYVLPRPFGISLNYMHQDQAFDVGDIFVNGVDVKTPGVAVVDEVQNDVGTYTLRFDAWILPFWNVYGILSRSYGDATGELMLDLEPVFPLLCARPGNNCQVDAPIQLGFEGDVVGYGTTVAGGYKDFFGMIDYNRTRASLDIFTNEAVAKVLSARIGFNGKLGNFAGVMWVGAMYQDIENTLELQIDVGEDVLDVALDQSTQSPTNFLIGGQWDINRSFSVLAEFGFGNRTSQMVNLSYRF